MQSQTFGQAISASAIFAFPGHFLSHLQTCAHLSKKVFNHSSAHRSSYRVFGHCTHPQAVGLIAKVDPFYEVNLSYIWQENKIACAGAKQTKGEQSS